VCPEKQKSAVNQVEWWSQVLFVAGAGCGRFKSENSGQPADAAGQHQVFWGIFSIPSDDDKFVKSVWYEIRGSGEEKAGIWIHEPGITQGSQQEFFPSIFFFACQTTAQYNNLS
jgi:hypothetical protein